MLHRKILSNYFRVGNIIPNQTHIARIYNGLKQCQREKKDYFSYKLKAIELSKLLKIQGLRAATKGIHVYMNIANPDNRVKFYSNEVIKLEFDFTGNRFKNHATSPMTTPNTNSNDDSTTISNSSSATWSTCSI